MSTTAPEASGPDRRQLLLLFEKEWDRTALGNLNDRYHFRTAGFDPQRPGGMLRLPGFDPVRYTLRLAGCYRGRGLAGVLSNQEHFGALSAALLARELGLPGHDPAAVARTQHKFHCRQVLARALPEAVPAFALLPDRPHADFRPPMGYPCFVKPVKANFSILARRVDNAIELARHLARPWPERWLFRLLNGPYERACRQLPGVADMATGDVIEDLTESATRFIAEGLLRGRQLNVDGYVHAGQVRILGVVDEVMYPGTSAFLRFDLPARLPPGLETRLADLTGRAVTALGLSQGMFNVEWVWRPETDRLDILEVNPRMASQFADLYRAVHGLDLHAIACALACGDDPARLPELAPTAGVGASFVFRRFDGGGPGPAGRDAARRRIRAVLPQANTQLYFKPAWARRLEYRWLGSHRYAVVNLAAPDRAALGRDFETLSTATGWPALWVEP